MTRKPVDLAARRAAARKRHPTAYTDVEREAMAALIGERIFHASTVDGATASPLMHEEAANLAGAVVDLLDECRAAAR